MCVGGGLIPAHAGKTYSAAAPPTAERAHPRSRGENVTVSAGWEKLAGSSPLTRGKLLGFAFERTSAGLIPAHAGKTAREWRGDALVSGSSPLTRGKRVAPPAPPVGPGLIPAHAGKTRSSAGAESGQGAHPRSRGENRARRRVRRSWGGSSPLTRGKLGGLCATSCSRGLIPAHAGKTCSSRFPSSDVRAHPRSRGENTS